MPSRVMVGTFSIAFSRWCLAEGSGSLTVSLEFSELRAGHQEAPIGQGGHPLLRQSLAGWRVPALGAAELQRAEKPAGTMGEAGVAAWEGVGKEEPWAASGGQMDGKSDGVSRADRKLLVPSG